MDSPLDRVMRLLNSYRFSQAVSVATRLGIPDLLASGAKTTEELARLASAQRDPLYQILRASASCGVFAEDDSGRFVNTPMSECLRSDAPGAGRNNACIRSAVSEGVLAASAMRRAAALSRWREGLHAPAAGAPFPSAAKASIGQLPC
jgi:Dimerisation domain